jgi:2-dehydropantoate 2-reductase
MLLAVGARYRRLRSSMLSAIERGRPPSVEFLNGEIVRRGQIHGVPTPFNEAARDMVLAIASGKMRPGISTLRDLSEKRTG